MPLHVVSSRPVLKDCKFGPGDRKRCPRPPACVPVNTAIDMLSSLSLGTRDH